MERFESHVIETKENGTKIVKNSFFNEDTTNYMALAHSHFTRDERKIAKNKHKNQ